ncbi:hypothetical protein P389DRAFT_20266 [Cystobasidium minutum MCA 4210]|uniref:uncharacterized protein n=1 Tax=Cystobasidium minutum MCA 4210 TaxID=1397322 RepID=UPI0034CD6735|eukprot:jgi/Rhomi1/20266/CE20265_68
MKRLGPGGTFLVGCDSIGKSTLLSGSIVVAGAIDVVDAGAGGGDADAGGGDTTVSRLFSFAILASNARFSIILAGSGRLVIPGILLYWMLGGSLAGG